MTYESKSLRFVSYCFVIHFYCINYRSTFAKFINKSTFNYIRLIIVWVYSIALSDSLKYLNIYLAIEEQLLI